MTHAMKIREYPRNVSIITEGDNGQEMFILERGSILVTKGIGIFVNKKLTSILLLKINLLIGWHVDRQLENPIWSK